MAWRAAIFATGALALGCQPAATTPSSPAQAVESPARVDVDAPAPSTSTAPAELRRAPDLTWDSAVGWEQRVEFPPGVTGGSREEGVDYINLRYFPWDDPKRVTEFVATLPKLDSISVLLPHEHLCETALRDGLSRAAPASLLVRIDGDPSADEWDCLEHLGPSDLYLGLCPYDGNTISRCDGDAQLDALALRSTLRGRVRGLAIGFQHPHHWNTLAMFPRLSMLTVNGPVVREPPNLAALRALCALPELAYVDLLDANEPGSDPRLPVDCALGLETYKSWRLLDGEPDWGIPPTPVPARIPCRLRRVMLWSADEATRAVLSRCEGLTLEVIDEWRPSP